MKKEKDILQHYIAHKRLRLTRQRQFILETFLSMESHVSAEELYKEVSKRDPSIGLATVYRTLHLLSKSGLAQERQFGDGQTRYEHDFNHSHHDHLICTECGDITEFEHPMIERLQEEIADRNKFSIYTHRLDIYGLCKRCNKKGARDD